MNAETLDVIEYLQKLLDAAIAGQETLQKALVESQRREQAAVEFIHELRCDDSGDWGDIMFKIDKWRERCVKAWEVRNED